MEFVILPVITFLIAILTFFSGFGLGTLLTPVLMIFFPADIAVIMTGIIHFSNNIFKLFLTGAHADKYIVIRFGIPAVIAAFMGALLLVRIHEQTILYEYTINSHKFEISTMNLILATFMLIFALADILPSLKKLQFEEKHMITGGILSGFFGGFSGHQGALRSAFLIKSNLSKEAFIGTAIVLSTMVDFTRIGLYATKFNDPAIRENLKITGICILTGTAGSFIGNKLLKKVTINSLQTYVGYFLVIISLLLGLGIL
jgi:uncharacterized membrane protein YfcA